MDQRSPFPHKFLNILKGVLIVVTFGFVFYKLFYAYHIQTLYQEFAFDSSVANLLLLFIVILLAGANWFIESLKWKLLISRNEPMSMKESVVGVLSGVAMGMITPNQIGNFVGRVIHLKELNKIKGSLVSVIGNTAQMLMTLIFGLMASIIFLANRHLIDEHLLLLLLGLLLVLIVLAIYMFFHIEKLSRLKASVKWTTYLKAFAGYSNRDLTFVLIYSMLRYLIFVLQYVLLVWFYHIDISWLTALMCICASLFIQAFVPSFILLDIGMRGASALWLFGIYVDQPTAILLMTYSVWVINLMIPGIIGLFFILRWRARQ